jgi:hypothetical protein
MASYQIQSGNHGAQIYGDHDGGKLERCSILKFVVVRVTLRCLGLEFFVVSHDRVILFGVLLCVVLAVPKWLQVKDLAAWYATHCLSNIWKT